MFHFLSLFRGSLWFFDHLQNGLPFANKGSNYELPFQTLLWTRNCRSNLYRCHEFVITDQNKTSCDVNVSGVFETLKAFSNFDTSGKLSQQIQPDKDTYIRHILGKKNLVSIFEFMSSFHGYKMKDKCLDPWFIMLMDGTPANCLEVRLSCGEVG